MVCYSTDFVMKHSHFKHVILASLATVALVAVGFAQVNINAPKGLNGGNQTEPEKKTEATTSHENAGENATKAEGTTADPNAENRPVVTRPQQPNNTVVNARENEKKKWVDSKKPESLNTDFSTGSNSNNLQSKQEVEMRSYGYRILVYQTNKSKNAKNNAQKRARDISVRFPQYHFYFNYKAPTWKLRMGDFADEESAHRAMKQMRQAFPVYSKEMTIIHDHINVWK